MIRRRMSSAKDLLTGFVLVFLIANVLYVSSQPHVSRTSSVSTVPRTDFTVLAADTNITFDFDTATPALSAGQGTPIDQTLNGVTAHFSSPSDPAFSIQSHDTTFFVLSQFSGKYLYPNNMNRNALDITFSQPVTSITVVFAAVEYRDQVEVPSNITLTAYVNNTGSNPIGSNITRGTFASDTFPMGTLTFSSVSQPFSAVEIIIPFRPMGASTFLADNITVTLAPPVPESNSLILLSFLILSLALALIIRKRLS